MKNQFLTNPSDKPSKVENCVCESRAEIDKNLRRIEIKRDFSKRLMWEFQQMK
jgi:hypothetical protein